MKFRQLFQRIRNILATCAFQNLLRKVLDSVRLFVSAGETVSRPVLIDIKSYTFPCKKRERESHVIPKKITCPLEKLFRTFVYEFACERRSKILYVCSFY